jgi:hypothetical protein
VLPSVCFLSAAPPFSLYFCICVGLSVAWAKVAPSPPRFLCELSEFEGSEAKTDNPKQDTDNT